MLLIIKCFMEKQTNSNEQDQKVIAEQRDKKLKEMALELKTMLFRKILYKKLLLRKEKNLANSEETIQIDITLNGIDKYFKEERLIDVKIIDRFLEQQDKKKEF